MDISFSFFSQKKILITYLANVEYVGTVSLCVDLSLGSLVSRYSQHQNFRSYVKILSSHKSIY